MPPTTTDPSYVHGAAAAGIALARALQENDASSRLTELYLSSTADSAAACGRDDEEDDDGGGIFDPVEVKLALRSALRARRGPAAGVFLVPNFDISDIRRGSEQEVRYVEVTCEVSYR